MLKFADFKYDKTLKTWETWIQFPVAKVFVISRNLERDIENLNFELKAAKKQLTKIVKKVAEDIVDEQQETDLTTKQLQKLLCLTEIEVFEEEIHLYFGGISEVFGGRNAMLVFSDGKTTSDAGLV